MDENFFEQMRAAVCCYNHATIFQQMYRFIVCSTCGNKRCPKSTDHNLDCTNSNEPDQPGSRYSDDWVMPEEK